MLLAITACSPNGNIPNNEEGSNPFENAPEEVTNPEEKENAKLAVDELKKFVTLFNEDIRNENERAEIYASFKDPKLSGKTLKTDDGSFSCTMILELDDGGTIPNLKEGNIIYNGVDLENQTYWAKIRMTDNSYHSEVEFICRNNSSGEIFKVSGKIDSGISGYYSNIITSVKLNDGPELINDKTLTENDIKFNY